MSICIRNMLAEDLDRVVALSTDTGEAPRWSRQDWEKILVSDRAEPLSRCAMVAFSNGRPVGFTVANWLRGENAAEMETLVVEQAYRRQGIGGALVKACMDWVACAGASSLRLEVRASNTAALALYRRYGFSGAGVRRGYYSAPIEDALLLEAPLRSSGQGS